jgi:hypothetical protein
MERTRLLSLYRPTAGAPQGRPNELRHAQRLATHRNRNVVMPNNDTLYSSAWLHLKDRALLLSLPPASRYRSFQLLDSHTETVAVVHDGQFVLAGPGWSGETLGLPTVRSTTDLNWLLGRTEVRGPSDMQGATGAQRAATLAPFDHGHPRASAPDEPVPSTFLLPTELPRAGADFFDEVAALWSNNPPATTRARVIGWWRGLGFEADRPTAVLAWRGQLDAAAHAIKQAGAEVRQRAAITLGMTRRGAWQHDAVGTYGGDDLLRAATAWRGLGALPASEALYFSLSSTVTGEPLHGARSMALVIERARLPPFDGFWSLSLYSASDYFFVANPIERYAVGEHTPGLARGDDGSVRIDISHAQPARGAANWLPAPDAPYLLVLRLYRPRPGALSYANLLPLPSTL